MIAIPILIALLLPQNTATFATIQGQVTNASSGSGLPDAGVELSSVEPGVSRKYVVATSGDGTFSFKDISPGDYRVAASHAGFVRAEYGQRGTGGNGRTITLAAGDTVKDIGISLVETGAISGRILDNNRVPIPNAQVQALRFTNMGPMRLVRTAAAAITNDRGEYRLFWLPPDDYIVMAMPIRGTITDTLVRSDGKGYTVNSSVRPASGELILTPTEVPPIPFFYRDGNDPSNAMQLTLRAAENLRGVDITIRPPTTFAIRGKLVNLPPSPPAVPVPGRPFNPEQGALEIELEPRKPPTVRFTQSMPSGLVSIDRAKSTFEIRGVLPGEYWAIARIDGKEARAQVDVAGRNVEDVAISFVSGFDVPIKVSVDGQPDGPNFDRLLDSLRVSLNLTIDADGYEAEQVPGAPPGTLMASNVVPGTYRVNYAIIGGPVGYLKSTRKDGISVESGFRLDGPPVQPIEMVWGLSTGVITGLVTNSRLEPASDVTVVAMSNRGSFHGTSGPDGRFRITAVPPGDFRLYAWEAIPLYSWQDPEVMRRDGAKGVAVHLDDGSTATVNLTSLPPPTTPGK